MSKIEKLLDVFPKVIGISGIYNCFCEVINPALWMRIAFFGLHTYTHTHTYIHFRMLKFRIG